VATMMEYSKEGPTNRATLSAGFSCPRGLALMLFGGTGTGGGSRQGGSQYRTVGRMRLETVLRREGWVWQTDPLAP
jgi:hypothetical protein